MENLTFKTWVLSQTHSFIVAMANALVNSGQTYPTDDFNDVMTDVYNAFCYYDYISEGANTFTYGNFVVTVNKKARKIGLLNTRSGKFVETYCNKKDEFDVLIGLGVLWAKYNHIERPKFKTKKKLSELKPHDIFTHRGGITKYEFIGTVKNTSIKNSYVAFSLDSEYTYRFEDTIVVVEE